MRPPLIEHTYRRSFELSRASRMDDLHDDGIQRCRACDSWTDAPICRRCAAAHRLPRTFGDTP